MSKVVPHRRPVPARPSTLQPASATKVDAPQAKRDAFGAGAVNGKVALDAEQAHWGAPPAVAMTGAVSKAPGGVERIVEGPHGARARELTHAYVTLADGTKLKARMWLPLDAGPEKPCPLVLEALPYGAANGTEARDWVNHTQLADKGIGVVRLDLRGTGESTGSLVDEYTARERADIVEAMGSLTKQPFANGKAALMGNSWGAFNAAQIAATAPDALKAIVMSCGSEDRYADDVHYKGGALVGEQLVYGASFLSFVGRPPDPKLVGADWLKTWLERVDPLEPVVPKWLSHPDRTDGYWDTPSDKPSNVKVPVLAVGGWADSYSNSIPRMVAAGDGHSKGIIGTGGHGYPHLAAPNPPIPFVELTQAFLKKAFDMPGEAKAMPDLVAFMRDGAEPNPEETEVKGRWVAIDDMKHPQEIATRTFDLGQATVECEGQGRRGDGVFKVQSPQTLGAASGKFCPMGVRGQLAGDQAPDDAQSLCLDTRVGEKGLELFGAPVVKLKLRSDQAQGNLIVRLCDVTGDGTSTRISYGVLNLANRDGAEAPRPMKPGEEIEVQLKLDDAAYSVPPFHRLRVSVHNAYWPMFWPNGESPALEVNTKGSTLEVPEYVAREKHVTLPAPTPNAPIEAQSPVQTVSGEAYRATESVDEKTGVRTTEIHDDAGVSRDETGLTVHELNVQKYSVDPSDPLSAQASCTWTTQLSREGWSAEIASTATQRATATHFIVDSQLELKADGKVVMQKSWHHEVPRRNV